MCDSGNRNGKGNLCEKHREGLFLDVQLVNYLSVSTFES